MKTGNAMTLAASLSLGIAATPVMAGDRPISARISAAVPEVCNFTAQPLFVAAGQSLASGVAIEACNSGHGYSIAAITRPLDPGESVAISYGLDTTSLSAGGNTTIARRVGPAFRQVPITLSADALAAPITVSLSMNAI